MKEHIIVLKHHFAYELICSSTFKEETKKIGCEVDLIGQGRMSGNAIFSIKCNTNKSLDELVHMIFANSGGYRVVPRKEDLLVFNRTNEMRVRNTPHWLKDRHKNEPDPRDWFGRSANWERFIWNDPSYQI